MHYGISKYAPLYALAILIVGFLLMCAAVTAAVFTL